MTPREELKVVIDGADDTESLHIGICRTFAIGRWVSVEDRLPDEYGYYHVVDDGDDTVAYFDVECRSFHESEHSELFKVTHWLDLDLPEVEQ